MNNQNGFTLIELVVVIVILGILAAIAAPRFIALQEDARISMVDGVTGSVRGASALGHAKSLVDGVLNGTVDMEGSPVEILNGYPSAAGIDAAVDTEGITVTVDDAAGTAVFAVQTGCSLTYTEAPTDGVPSYAIDKSACK